MRPNENTSKLTPGTVSMTTSYPDLVKKGTGQNSPVSNVRKSLKMDDLMLTVDILKVIDPNTIFAVGCNSIPHPFPQYATRIEEGGVLAENNTCLVRWVAATGGVGDWAIYHSLDGNLTRDENFNSPDHLLVRPEHIFALGAKLHDETLIRQWVECDDEAFAKYRH